jgi:hypothetical protein
MGLEEGEEKEGTLYNQTPVDMLNHGRWTCRPSDSTWQWRPLFHEGHVQRKKLHHSRKNMNCLLEGEEIENIPSVSSHHIISTTTPISGGAGGSVPRTALCFLFSLFAEMGRR